MKFENFKLSLIGLMLGLCILSLPAFGDDKEVRELVDSVVTKSTIDTGAALSPIPAGDENAPVFKNAAQVEKKEKTQTGTWLWIRMFGSLALIITLIGGGAYFIKKSPVANKLNRQAKMIQVMGTHHMGAKKSLAVIRVAGETVLIGLTDQNITLLKSLSLLDDDLPGDPSAKQTNKFNATLSKKIQPEEEFSMKGIKDIVSNRLKNIREFDR